MPSTLDGSAPDGTAPDAPLAPDSGTDAAVAPPDATTRRCAPVEVASVGEGCFCTGAIAVWDGHLYRQDVALQTFSLADPLDPVLTARIEIPPTSDGQLVAHDGRLFATSDLVDTLFTYELADPAAPEPGPSLTLEAPGTAVDVRAGVGAVAVRGNPISTVVLFDPTSMAEIDEIPIRGSVDRLRIGDDGRTVFLLSDDDGTHLGVIDVMSRRAFPALDIDEQSTFFRDLEIAGDFLFITGFDPAIAVVDSSLWEVVARHPAEGSFGATAIAFDGDRAVVKGGPLRVLDMSDPRRPRELGRATIASHSAHVIVAGDVAYASGSNATTTFALNCD